MKRILLVAALLAGVPACLPTFYLPASPPQMTTVQLPEMPNTAYVKARQAVAAMGGHLLNHDATARLAYALVPGPVVLHIAVLPDRDGAEVLGTGRARSDRPVEDAGRALRAYTAFLHQAAACE
jgi:hypothetical protein